MPPGWKKLEFILKWHGHEIRFIYNNGKYMAKLENSDCSTQVPFFVDGREKLLTSEQPVLVIC